MAVSACYSASTFKTCGKTSLVLLSGRRTYVDLVIQPYLKIRVKGMRFYFYDLNGKINWIINSKHRVFALLRKRYLWFSAFGNISNDMKFYLMEQCFGIFTMELHYQ